VSINACTGAVTGTLSAGGSWAPTVTVTDGTYSNSVSFGWTVSSPISIIDPGGQSNSVGDAVSLPIAASGGGTLSYSATGLPAGLGINASTGLIFGSVSATAAGRKLVSVHFSPLFRRKMN